MKHSSQHEGKSALKITKCCTADAPLSKALGVHPETKSLLWAVVAASLLLFIGT